MRESIARGAAVGSGVLVVAAVGVFAWLQQSDHTEPGLAVPTEVEEQSGTAVEERSERALADALLERGIGVYGELRCASCHSIAGRGSPRSPLDGVGDRRTTEEIRLWIVDPQEMRPGIRKPAYDDLAEHDLEALMAYMKSLRAPGD